MPPVKRLRMSNIAMSIEHILVLHQSTYVAAFSRHTCVAAFSAQIIGQLARAYSTFSNIQ
jgi:hypothetical protein